MSKVKVVEPSEGLALISLWTDDGNIVDIPLSYKQDITGPFIKEFESFLLGEKNDGHMVLDVDGEDGKYIIISDDKKTYVIDEWNKNMNVCAANAEDIIRACIRSFIDYRDKWANFDINDEPGTPVNYMRDFLERKGFIEQAEDDIYTILKGRKS